MAEIIQIQRVEVGLKNLTARVRVSKEAPLLTSGDLRATTRVYNLMPHIIDHVCLGDSGETFKEVMGNTELAHLLEHVTVELLSQSSASGEITSGKTTPVPGENRTYDIQLSCPDDVLVAGALSSAVWIMNWAFSGGGEPKPDIEAIVSGLTNLVSSLGDEPAKQYEEQVERQIQDEVEQRRKELLAQREEELARRREAAEAIAAKKAAEARERLRAEREAREAQERERRPSWAVEDDGPLAGATEGDTASASSAAQIQRMLAVSPEAYQSSQDLLAERVAWEPPSEELVPSQEDEPVSRHAFADEPPEEPVLTHGHDDYASQLNTAFATRPHIDLGERADEGDTPGDGGGEDAAGGTADGGEGKVPLPWDPPEGEG